MLLDTHVWIWAVDGGSRLGPKTRRRLARAATADEALAVSTASVFEVAALHTAGRLQLTLSLERWIRESLERSGLQVLDVGRAIAVDAGLVPASALADPIDRVLVATAREHDVPLVTRDRALLDYARRTRLVRVVDASA